MQTITNKQIYDRWEQVPEALREAFFSMDNGEIIWKAGEDAGLPEDVIDNVLVVVGNVLFGFTHVNDLAKELQSIPGMDPKAVDPIIFQIDRRIFAPVKGEILKLYGEMAGTGPRIMVESATELAEGSKPVEVGGGAPAMIPTEGAQVEIRKVRIEGDMTTGVSASTGVVPAAATRPESTEGPTIIHAEAELKPVAQKKRPLSSFGGMFGFRKGQEQKTAGPVVAAQISMVEGLGKKPEDMARTEQQPVRVVHYTSAKAPEDMFAQPIQPQKEVSTFVPVAKQEHAVDFEPKVIDLAAHEELVTAPMGEPGKITPVPAMPEEATQVASMPKLPEVTVMKTPQRMETVAKQAPQAKEPQLAEIPVRDDIVDLRMLERAEDKK